MGGRCDSGVHHLAQVRHPRGIFGFFEVVIRDGATGRGCQCRGNPQAQRGYSRDSRPDCLQVCIGLVVTTDGIPLG
jgi:hypothetical protein